MNWKNFLMISGLALLTTACGYNAGDSAEWQYHYDLPEAKVVQAQDDFVLRYPENSHKAYLQDEVAFKRRIADVRPNQVERVTLVVPSNHSDKENYVVNLINETTLAGHTMRVVHDASLHNQTVLKITHWKADVAGCPDWSKPNGTDVHNTNGTNFGCSNALNLAAMVDNPHDVEVGRTPPAASGYQGALAVDRYRAGEIIDLRREDGLEDE